MFAPIPLTEQWLITFKFEQDGKDYFCNILRMVYNDKKNIFIAYPYGYPISPLRCLYVHQLQNLYFALTGKEL
jgi:hypothetical protein